MTEKDKHNTKTRTDEPYNVFATGLGLSPDMAPKTNGEKHYDRVIGGSTYGITLGASLLSAYIFKHTKVGRTYLLEPWEKTLRNKILPQLLPASKTSAELDHAATYTAEISSLMAGGTTPVYPFKKIEDDRVNRINRYNEEHGTGIDDPELEALAQERIDNLPIQSWSSALSGRGAAMGLTFAAGIPFDKQIEAAQLAISKPAVRALSMDGRLYAKEHEQAHFLGKMLVMDGTWSAYTSAILLGFSRLSARMFGNNDKGKDYIDPYTPIEVDVAEYRSRKAAAPQNEKTHQSESAVPVHAIADAEYQGTATKRSANVSR